MKREYVTEKEGQLDFFNEFNISFENNYNEEIIFDSHDGIYHGNLLEFKLERTSLSKTLFQSIKYLSKERIKGHNVPATIINVFLNQNEAYIYKSINYFKEIHTLYTGGASKNNDEFVNKFTPIILNLNKPQDHILLMQILQENNFMKVDIDENCIIGWAERYYRENPTKTKDDFLKDDGELRKPDKFKDFINPYKGESNEKFKYIMDKLNDKLKKKKLGAFYTPIPYCEKAAELVREAIKRVPEGNDYIIIDRCAGTGNLESVLTDEELSHCILSTYEYYEWLVLRERLEDKVRMILPEDKDNITFEDGLIKENDAMSEEFVNNSYIKQFIDDPKCTIIMLENPPYSDSATISGSSKSTIQESFIAKEVKNKVGGYPARELANQFIYSGFNYLLRDNDFFIIFSPIKYWKITDKIVKKEFIDGFIFNRKHFHATPSAVCCIMFKNKNDNIEILKDIPVYDINKDGKLENCNKKIDIKRVKKLPSEYYDKRTFEDDIDSSVYCGLDGYPTEKKPAIKPIYNNNIIGSMVLSSFTNAFNHVFLSRTNLYNGNNGSITHLRKDRYLNILPAFCAKLQHANSDNWYDDLYYSTSDGGTKFESDQTFLKSCLIYTCLCQFNKCLSFKGSDGRDYYNELCFDSISTHKSQARIDLASFKLNAKERTLLKLYDKIMKEASKTKNYKKEYSYGLYQIIQELNTYTLSNDNKKIPDYPSLNDDIETMKKKLKAYYKEAIEPKCFKYELLK